MSEAKQEKMHEESFPGGVTETDGLVPPFLKITYVFFVIFGMSYWFLYSAGDGSPLVQELNRATTVVMP